MCAECNSGLLLGNRRRLRRVKGIVWVQPPGVTGGGARRHGRAYVDADFALGADKGALGTDAPDNIFVSQRRPWTRSWIAQS